MYASFQNREDGIALKLMETLNEMKIPQFKLVLRFSDQKSPRWGQEFLTEHISKDVEKIWVCGPPLMNENFDKSLEVVCKLQGINFLTQVDLM